MLLVLLCRLLCLSVWSWSDVTRAHGGGEEEERSTKDTFSPREYEPPGTGRAEARHGTGGTRRWHDGDEVYDRVLGGQNGRAHHETRDTNSVWTWVRKNNPSASSSGLKSGGGRGTNQDFVRKMDWPEYGEVPGGVPRPRTRGVERRTHTDKPAATEGGGYGHVKSRMRHTGGHHPRGHKLVHGHYRDTVGRHRRNAKDAGRESEEGGRESEDGEREERDRSLHPTALSISNASSQDAASPSAWEPLPQPLAQNQSLLDSQFDDYEPFTSPDIADNTPFVPFNPRPRRKLVRNPFYPLTAESAGAYSVLIISLVIFSVGILGNVAVMCIVCHNYYMRSISNSLLANLALWDFVVIFFCLPLVVFHELTKDWLLGDFSCKIIPYLEVVSLGVTTFTLCALCIDRFRAATNVQLYYEMVENCASTGAKLAVIWTGALLLALPELLLRQLVREEEGAAEAPAPPPFSSSEAPPPPPAAPLPYERCVVRVSTDLPDTLYVLGLTYDGARLWWYFGCYFCLPTLFTIACSLATVRKIRKMAGGGGGSGVGGGGSGVGGAARGGNKKQLRLESQMNCAVVALAILYGFCSIPENVCNVVTAYMAAGVPRRTLDVLRLVSQMFLFCKSAGTPVLLFCLCRPFSQAFLDCCCCCCRECGPPAPQNAAVAVTTSDDEDGREAGGATELEMMMSSRPFRGGGGGRRRGEGSGSTSPYATVGMHC